MEKENLKIALEEVVGTEGFLNKEVNRLKLKIKQLNKNADSYEEKKEVLKNSLKNILNDLQNNREIEYQIKKELGYYN